MGPPHYLRLKWSYDEVKPNDKECHEAMLQLLSYPLCYIAEIEFSLFRIEGQKGGSRKNDSLGSNSKNVLAANFGLIISNSGYILKILLKQHLYLKVLLDFLSLLG